MPRSSIWYCAANQEKGTEKFSLKSTDLKAAMRSYGVERAKGIEPSYAAWEAAVLPLNYAREINDFHLPFPLSTFLARG